MHHVFVCVVYSVAACSTQRAPLSPASREGKEEAAPAGSAKWFLGQAPGASRKSLLALVGPGKAPALSQQS
jgi:hypothetical protein